MSFHSRSFDSSSKVTAAGAADRTEAGVGPDAAAFRVDTGTVVGSGG